MLAWCIVALVPLTPSSGATVAEECSSAKADAVTSALLQLEHVRDGPCKPWCSNHPIPQSCTWNNCKGCSACVTTTTTTTTTTTIPSPFGYTYVGTGYCHVQPGGYIGGWYKPDAVDLDTCARKCSSELNCKYFSLWVDHTCARYSDDPGNCTTRWEPSNYITYVRAPGRSYVPGEPGAVWMPEHQKDIRAKLIRVFQEPDGVCREGNIQVPGERWSGLPTMAKFLRLAFHDCMKYADGTGGCDGCLEWTGVGERFSRDQHGKAQLNASDDGHNNGLQPTVEILEKIYTDPTFPQKAPALPRSPKDSGISRADLWAFAGMVAVEHGILLNNLACQKLDLDDTAGILSQCHPRVGEPDCEVAAPRPFTFASGRKDCIPDPTVDRPYKTFKKELHPDPNANASVTLNYFKRDFGFNARETVAILGAHTLGRVHNTISLFQYTWKTRSAMLFNNGYFRNLASKEDWYYPTGSFPDGKNIRSTTCRGFGNSSGQRPPARWKPHAFVHLTNGGPVQWLQEKKACPCFDTGFTRPEEGCCSDDIFSCKAGCEQYRIVVGMDETMLSSDMSLYRDFSTNEGIPGGCPGLDGYSTESILSDWRLRTPRVPPGDVHGDSWDSSYCPFTTIADPPGSTPMYQVVEEYADSNEKFFSDFFPVLEKMLKNGYSTEDLQETPMASHACPYQDPHDWHRYYSCF
ncbi:APX1 [Symbiodinium sp. CCMP2592]|nr:APX1 [Symbiodinium sp. CCMP2592]